MNKAPYVVALALSKQLKCDVSVGACDKFTYFITDGATMVVLKSTSYTAREMLGKGAIHLKPEKANASRR